MKPGQCNEQEPFRWGVGPRRQRLASWPLGKDVSHMGSISLRKGGQTDPQLNPLLVGEEGDDVVLMPRLA